MKIPSIHPILTNQRTRATLQNGTVVTWTSLSLRNKLRFFNLWWVAPLTTPADYTGSSSPCWVTPSILSPAFLTSSTTWATGLRFGGEGYSDSFEQHSHFRSCFASVRVSGVCSSGSIWRAITSLTSRITSWLWPSTEPCRISFVSFLVVFLWARRGGGLPVGKKGSGPYDANEFEFVSPFSCSWVLLSSQWSASPTFPSRWANCHNYHVCLLFHPCSTVISAQPWSLSSHLWMVILFMR